jgi:hypothetical protein
MHTAQHLASVLVTACAICAAAVPSYHAAAQPAPPLAIGAITVRATPHGSFAYYMPKSGATRVLALVHGTIPVGDDGVVAAREMVALFQGDAERRRIVLVAPAFSDADFGGHAGPGGGFRGLFGRRVRADVFLDAVVDDMRAAVAPRPESERGAEPPRRSIDQPFDLLGHSAGGQFVSRYVVMRSDRVRTAVICASGTFAFPDPAFRWAEGMAPLQRSWRWGDDPEVTVDIQPDPAGWLAAAELRVIVIVGENDPTDVPKVAGQRGDDLKERSRLWVDAMNALAKEHGKSGRVQYRQVPKAAHGMRELLPECRRALWP